MYAIQSPQTGRSVGPSTYTFEDFTLQSTALALGIVLYENR